jgi:RNA polymerase sigma-70 factor (ECF subfamily)
VADRTGDFGSFEELAMPHFAKLYNFAHWLTQDRAAAEDLVQETYMKALRGFSSFQQGTNFRAWMYKILRNTFLTTQSGLKAWASVSLDSDDDDKPTEPAASETPESVLLARVQQETIQSALESLPVKFREIVLLCDLEEMTYQEIGETLGIPIGTVMSRLSRARKAVRGLLTEKLQGASR